MKSLYLLINFFTVIVPVIFSFHPRLQFYKHWKAFFYANGIIALIFIGWDILFTKLGVWNFNPDYITGIYLFNLPIEEILFFICIPFACVFTYHCLNILFPIRWAKQTEHTVVLILALGLLTIGVYHHDKLYTSTTFISLSLVLLFLKHVVKVDWLGQFLTVYTVLLIPFCIVNGILTGYGLEQPVVRYNDAENLGIRLITIPVEDVSYGLELVLLNVFLYRYFNSNSAKSKTL